MQANDFFPLVPLAWNGVALSVPEDWRPARLGLGYLFFEDADGPAFECKWRRGAGREGMEAALRALTPKGRATAGGQLPDDWLAALADFELMPLSWGQAGRAGLGAALFCPDCGLAAVFQGFAGPDGFSTGRKRLLASVLRSFRHHDPGPPAFRLFGLSFVAPPGFALAAHEFVPGRFVLSFAAGRERLDVVRLAPADVLLAAADLGAVAARAFGSTEAEAQSPGTVAGCPAVWLARRQGSGFLDVAARHLGRQGRLAVLRHDRDANKLLGAALASARPVDREWLAETAAACVSL
ncbi:hypothetical protein DFW101_3245 [Solidesulfovibrio carbinoliphilus subsp. oakridgensis]|uniref:Uncharacterized protein n=1 Tax=Solidesulfovibrio carbinoliphilus subsp. oakridgensis TaxID=694327 RepID=G7QAL3_9BACT|nr:hypothetical protein [Solidesulfovibrio carbinoliphilus]EHJ49244.1 hypothetical protein DFW101_3245 [Solidesulfovibrio carbinoliphilus subsp. oakridgensis]